mmetsp:Transcript_55817/g.83159  ORF Transcript_55817/g.83159 Transcript_55817/m.83159 type:complete len:159 (+) Transcript_55817:68-544(+)
MKFSSVAATALFLLSAPALGFSTSSRSVSSFLPQTREIHRSRPSFTSALPPKHSYANTAMSMSYSVGIVGATGAVGKEIVGVLENRGFPVSDLRIFGSSRSAGKEVETKFGKVNVELFDVDSARECDVVFLAVSGDFALEHAKKISEGEDGAVVIDNS